MIGEAVSAVPSDAGLPPLILPSFTNESHQLQTEEALSCNGVEEGALQQPPAKRRRFVTNETQTPASAAKKAFPERISTRGRVSPQSSNRSSPRGGSSKAKSVTSSVVESVLPDTWQEDFLSCPPETRYRFLMRKYNEVWVARDMRPETLASVLRKGLGQVAPRNTSGEPEIYVPVGFTCQYKAQLALLGLHSSPMMGICSDERTATAIVVNGGYADDVDRGSMFIYVGEGGESTGASQALNRGNLGLLNACERGLPVRVIRGYQAHSRFAPPYGFRYDGLYKILNAYWDVGMQDRRVWKYIFQALPTEGRAGGPSSCGCTDQEVLKHLPDEEVVREAIGLSPEEFAALEEAERFRLSQKVRSTFDKQIKVHQKVQAADFAEPKRSITVIGDSKSSFQLTINISQLLGVPRRRRIKQDEEELTSGRDSQESETSPSQLLTGSPAPDSQSPSFSTASVGLPPHYKLPTFLTLLGAIVKRGGPPEWLDSVHARYALPQDDPSKPAWARYGFLPLVLQLRASSEKDGSRKCSLNLPISEAFSREHSIPYFPQSKRDGINVRLRLRAPFPDEYDPKADVSQLNEATPIVVINEVDEAPPPSDFTYIRESISFSPSVVNLPPVCCGCVPSDQDTSKWIPVTRSANKECSGLKDPETDKIYCCGVNYDKQEIRMIGDCSSSTCPCDADHCTNRRWKRGLQYKVSLQRLKGLGWGVIAEEDIPGGVFVMEYAGDLIHFGEMKARVHKYEVAGHNNFCFEIFKTSDDVVEEWRYPCIDSLFFGNIARFINHGCSPNLIPTIHYHHNNQGRCLSLVSLRLITKGEQLFYDYGPSYTDLACLCGAPNCRMFIKKLPCDDPSLVKHSV